MKYDTKEPCSSCPYRRDAKISRWHPDEFDRLKEMDESTMGAIFGCHATAKCEDLSVCAGWLLDQRERGVPSNAMRMALFTLPEAMEGMKAVGDGGHELYGSIDEMVEANEALGRCEGCGRYLTEGPHEDVIPLMTPSAFCSGDCEEADQ